MKTSIQVRNGVSSQMVDLVVRLVDLIPWPSRRTAMGDVTTSLLDGKPRVAEDVFGWNRATVELGMNEWLLHDCSVSRTVYIRTYSNQKTRKVYSVLVKC